MIGTYRVEGERGRGASDQGVVYFGFQREVREKLGSYTPLSMNEGCIWEMDSGAVILSAEGGWAPRFTLIPDSKKMKADLEKRLGVKLIN